MNPLQASQTTRMPITIHKVLKYGTPPIHRSFSVGQIRVKSGCQGLPIYQQNNQKKQ